MLDFVKRYGCDIYSQNGEDGIIDEVLRRIGLNHGVAVEFGAPTKSYCSNTFALDNLWQKFYYDNHPQESGIIRKVITEQNVNDLPVCNVLSIDIDGNDYNVWKAYRGSPEIVIIEINSSYAPELFRIHGIHGERGTGYMSMVQLGIQKGYFLLAHTGNLVFTLNKYRELFPEIIGDGLSNCEKYFNPKWL